MCLYNKMKKSKTQRKDLIYSIDTKTFTDLPTLPTLQKLKKSTSQPWILASTRSIRTFDRPYLTKLRTRKKPAAEITPTLVQKVLKKYFIPIFEAQRHRQRSLKTSRTAEFSQSLSESLIDSLKKHQSTLRELNWKLKLIDEDRDQKQKEISEFKREIFNLEGIINASKAYAGTFSENEVEVKEELGEIDGRINSENRKLKNKLAQERNWNLELKHNSMVLEHWNSLYNMQSDIMGEQLKGLYFSCNQLSLNSISKNYKFQITLCHKSCVRLIKQERSVSTKIHSNLKSLYFTIQKSLKTIDSRKTLLKELKERSSAIKYDQEWHQSEIRKRIEEKEIYNIRFLELEKKNTTLEDEYDKMRTVILEIKKKSKFYDLEEKVCKYCKKVFTERENFNWSCRNHLSEWGENNNYWCCGAEDKEALGCQLSKHVSDEGNESKVVEKKELKNLKARCRNCRNIGHVASECPRDPNPKTSKGFKKLNVKRPKEKVSYLALAKLKNEEYVDDEEFEDIQLARREAVIDEFQSLY